MRHGSDQMSHCCSIRTCTVPFEQKQKQNPGLTLSRVLQPGLTRRIKTKTESGGGWGVAVGGGAGGGGGAGFVTT